MNRIALRCLCLAASTSLALLAGCRNAGPDFGQVPHLVSYYVPFIESIDAPDTLSVGEHSEILLHVSFQQNPELLYDPAYVWNFGISGVSGENKLMPYLIARADGGGAIPAGPPGPTVVVKFLVEEPGLLRYEFAGTADAAQGGNRLQFNQPGSGVLYPLPVGDYFAFQTAEITVLPAP